MNSSKISTCELTVRYGETDKMGVVYYGNYGLYLEVARTKLIKDAGLSYKIMEDEGLMLPVVDLHISYKKPAYYDDNLSIETQIVGIPSRKIIFESSIFNKQQELLAKGYVTLVFVDSNTRKVISCPKDVINILAPYCK